MPRGHMPQRVPMVVKGPWRHSPREQHQPCKAGMTVSPSPPTAITDLFIYGCDGLLHTGFL